MTQGFCTDKAALIGFLYDDCEPGERERIAGHVAHCPECTAELASLAATRSQLAAWATPQAGLGFQIDPAQMGESLTAAPFTVIEGGNAEPARGGSRPGEQPWWKQPLPAWAQAAAAVLIFASGVGFGTAGFGTAGFGTGRGTAAPDRVSAPPAASPARQGVRATPVVATAPAVSAEELGRLEQQLQAMQGEIAALRAASRIGPAAGSEHAVTLAQVNDAVTNSKKELLQQMLWRDAAWQKVREDDMRQIEGMVSPLRAQVPADRMPASYGPAYGLQMRPTVVSYPR